jgi:hypothetical protein
MLTKPPTFIVAAAVTIAAIVGGYAAFLSAQGTQTDIRAGHPPIWSKIKWPFPVDLWGQGLAYRCGATDCGSEVHLYVRAKIGLCSCPSAIDDEMVDRVGDVDLIASERGTLRPGRAINVRSMNGRSRAYLLGEGAIARSALTIAFHDRCDLIVATAAIAHSEPDLQEGAVLQFLSSDLVQRWAEITLGL